MSNKSHNPEDNAPRLIKKKTLVRIMAILLCILMAGSAIVTAIAPLIGA